MRIPAICRLMLCLVLAGISSTSYPQAKKAPSLPRIDVLDYRIEATLVPDTHEITASATVVFTPGEPTDRAVFELNENLSVQKILNTEGIELEFNQNEGGPGFLAVRYSKPLTPGTSETIKIEYAGGFDRDRFSRMYIRDESSAYIGMEGIYLMYSSKWFPVSRFLSNRTTATVQITVPLGMTAIGPGAALPVITKGINEIFGYSAKTPILPNIIVAGRYLEKKVQIGDFMLDCYAREDKLDAIQKSADAAAKILAYYQEAYGPAASGKNFRLVEVDDRLSLQPGMLGTIFITHSELAQSLPPVRELARRIAYQWWQDTIGMQSSNDLWLVDGMAYFSAAQYMSRSQSALEQKEEMEKLAVLALKFENKSPVRTAYELGFRNESYESVVAGKGAWILNMLKGVMGESRFNQLVQQYIKEFTGKGGSTAAFQKMAEKIYGKDLGWFFSEWIDTIGVPSLEADYVIFKTQSGFRVSGTLKQERDLFRMPIEVGATSLGKQEIIAVELSGKSTAFDVNTVAMPESVVLDPNGKLLRDSPQLKTAVQISLGGDMRQKGDYVGAVRAYESAIKTSPHSSYARFRLAEAFFEQMNLQSAADTFREALNEDREPRWIEVWCYIYLGKIYDILGQRQRAMAEYTKAVNTKDDTNGAQAEANKYLAAPYVKERTTMDTGQ
jgi:aminopeptidase N